MLLKYYFGIWFLVLLNHFDHISANVVSICSKTTRYEQEMDECPGGIQLRNDGRWLNKFQGKMCICGKGTILHFDGEDKPWHEWIYPADTPRDSIPFLGSWKYYNLSQKCEGVQSTVNHESALLIDATGYQNFANFPTRAMELIVTPNEHKRLPGSYSIEIKRGLQRRSDAKEKDLLKTIMLNTREPVLIIPDIENRPWDKVCAYDPTIPAVILSKYITTTWNLTNTLKECLDYTIPPYLPQRRICKTSCLGLPLWNGTSEDANPDRKSRSFLKIFEVMGEVSMRMKFAEKRLPFTKENGPLVALLQLSSRLFFRAFPNVLKWETLLNAVTIFGIAFEGLIPNKIRGERFDQIRLALGRCTLQQERDYEKNYALYNQICSALPAPSPSSKKNKRQVNKTSTISPPVATFSKSEYNKLIDLIWKMVQFAQIKCLSELEHHPNVHHFYVEAMSEVFTSPAVQLLWYENTDRMDKAMLYVLPELPDNTLPIIDSILEKVEYSTYFNVLQRPKIEDLEKRDMACAGHGKLIWGGKACCYYEEDDRKYRFFNRVAYAKL